MTARLDRFERRHRSVSFPLAVMYKYFDDHGNYLAALITYYGFLSLFPLLLLLVSVLGFVLQGDPELQRTLLDSTLRQFPVVGDELVRPTGLQGNGTALAVGALLALYGSLGIAQALQHAMNVVWAVPRYRRPNPIRARLRGLLLIGTGGVAVLVTTALTAVAARAAQRADLAWAVTLAVSLASFAVNAAIFVVAFRIATARELGLRDVVPGALVAGAAWQLLQLGGTAYVSGPLQGSNGAYGVFALVLGLLGWMYLGASAIVFAAEVNVVRAKRLYPRALLTPFTDDVDLTGADRQTYAESATAQRAKEFESIDVSFNGEEQPVAGDDAHGDPGHGEDGHGEDEGGRRERRAADASGMPPAR